MPISMSEVLFRVISIQRNSPLVIIYNDDLSLYETGTQQVNNYPGSTVNEWDC
jgi:hypothetical protein